MEKEKQETEELTLDEVCLNLNTYSDLSVLYCIDERPVGRARPVIVKMVRDDNRLRLLIVTDTLTERKAREKLTEISRVRM